MSKNGMPRPLVGNQELRAGIRSALRNPDQVGVLLSGHAGMGKSSLGRQLLLELKSDLEPFWIFPAAPMTNIPLGALSPYLDSCPESDKKSSLTVLRHMERLLDRRAEAREAKIIAVIDDAHLLDDDSSQILAQLAVTGFVKLLVLCRPKPGLPTGFESLWQEGLLPRFDLAPLKDLAVHELCRQILGGEVLTSASMALGHLSGGNPLFLLALIDAARETDQLVQHDQVWSLTNYMPRTSPHLRDLVREQLSGKSPAELELLELVALAEPLPLAWLIQLHEESDLDALEEEHLIRVSKGSQRLVRSVSPLMGEVVRGLVPPARSSIIRSRIAGVMNEPCPEETWMRFVCWSLDCGAPVSGEALLRAAATANRYSYPTLALRLAGAIVEDEHLITARVEMAHAHFDLGNLSQAATMLEDSVEGLNDPATLKVAATLRARIHLKLGGTASELTKIAATWRDSTDRILGQTEGKEPAEPGTPDYSRLMHLRGLLLDGRYALIEDELATLCEDATVEATFRRGALSLWAELLEATGRPAGAVRATGEALQLLAAPQEDKFRYYEVLLVRHSLGLVQLGKWKQASQLLTEDAAAAFRGGLYVSGGRYLVEGLVAVKQGDMPAALIKLSAATVALRGCDIDHLLPYALGLAAYAASLVGRTDLVERFTAEWGQLLYRASAHHQLLGEVHLAASQASVNGASAAARDLRRLADRARETGLCTAERESRELALRLGDGDQLERLVELTDVGEGAEAECLNAYLRGVFHSDANELIAAGEQAKEMQYNLLAAECLGQAVKLLKASGDRKRVRAVVHLLQLCRSELAGISSVALQDPIDAVELTPRERDIVTMVVNGKSNREIAELATLSVRTVEGHLYRIFSKLGINRRDELTSSGLSGMHWNRLSLG